MKLNRPRLPFAEKGELGFARHSESGESEDPLRGPKKPDSPWQAVGRHNAVVLTRAGAESA